MPTGSKWGFGSDKRKGVTTNSLSPGAGTYQIPSKMVEGPKYVMGQKLSNELSGGIQMNPGPGQYDL
jgi:hypothetical protein